METLDKGQSNDTTINIAAETEAYYKKEVKENRFYEIIAQACIIILMVATLGFFIYQQYITK